MTSARRPPAAASGRPPAGRPAAAAPGRPPAGRPAAATAAAPTASAPSAALAGLTAREDARGVTFDILVQPRASRARLGPLHGDRLKVAVTAPPVDGEANAAVIELVARALGVARSAVEVTAGASSRRKTLRVAGITLAQLAAAVQP